MKVTWERERAFSISNSFRYDNVGYRILYAWEEKVVYVIYFQKQGILRKEGRQKDYFGRC